MSVLYAPQLASWIEENRPQPIRIGKDQLMELATSCGYELYWAGHLKKNGVRVAWFTMAEDIVSFFERIEGGHVVYQPTTRNMRTEDDILLMDEAWQLILEKAGIHDVNVILPEEVVSLPDCRLALRSEAIELARRWEDFLRSLLAPVLV